MLTIQHVQALRNRLHSGEVPALDAVIKAPECSGYGVAITIEPSLCLYFDSSPSIRVPPLVEGVPITINVLEG